MIEGVRTRHAVSYEWERAAHVRDLRAGLLKREDVCDADFLLQAAAEYHGRPAGRPCPVCGEMLSLTLWVYGEQLGRRAGSARNTQEIAEMVADGLTFTVHSVEVCRQCRWNHLLEAAEAY